MFRSSHSLPVDHMHFSLYISSAPDEVSLDLVNLLSNFRMKGYELTEWLGILFRVALVRVVLPA